MLDRPEEGVDHRVPGHENVLLRHALREQVGCVPLGRTEVQGRESGNEPAIDLFGERRPVVAGA